MEHTEPGNASDLAQDVMGDIGPYETIRPVPLTEFAAWHRPRKQFVRENQWAQELNALLDEFPPTDTQLRYLGLPGHDLLDLRYLRTVVCEPRQLHLRYLGFNSAAQPNTSTLQQMMVSQDQVKRAPYVHELSDIRADDFVRLGTINSLAHKAAVDHGPFDVANVDLCDGFGQHAPERVGGTYYQAVQNLCAIQAHRQRPWLLFLTTRADRPTVDNEVLERLIEKFKANLEEHTDFLEASAQHFGIACETTLARACETQEGHLRVFTTALAKWFIGVGLRNAPPTKVTIRNIVAYSVAGLEQPDLVSIAFRFTPTFIATPDPMGLAVNPPQPPSEGALATKALRRVVNLRNADQSLAEDGELCQRMINETGEMLVEARYDLDAYRAWVRARGVAATA